ncbi:MAG: apolipoprotein N-acyltransferase [candidate division NC10 bacterium]|nr:apolipoprotein N-acyltransferase [candidate division NC10 bacterium]
MKLPQKWPAPLGRDAALVGLSAVPIALAFPTFNLSWLAFVGLVPLLWATRRATPRRAAWLGWLSGTVFFTINLFWLTHAMTVYGHIPGFLAVGLLLLLAVYLGAHVGAFALGWAWVAPRSLAGQILLPPTLWTALEYVRTYALTGFPWGFLAYTQAGNLPLIQMAAWTGVYGVSWVLVLSNAVVAAALDRDIPLVRRALALIAVAGILAGLSALGAARLDTAERGEPIRVVAVQGNVSQDVKWLPEVREEVLQRYERLTLKAGQAGATLIVWPETAIPYLIGVNAPIRARLAALARKTGSQLLVGSVDAELASPPRYFNSAFHVAPDRGIVAKYDKIHLVPFGEYIPLRPLLGFVDKLTQGAIGDFQAGREYTVFDLGGARFGVTISYEVYFPDQVRRYFQAGADFLVNITNDAWYGRTAAPYQHVNMVVFRAVENNAYLVRAANTGISAVVDSTGRVLAASDLFQEGILVETIRTRPKGTFYTRYGDVFAWSSLGFVLFAVFMKGTRGISRTWFRNVRPPGGPEQCSSEASLRS